MESSYVNHEVEAIHSEFEYLSKNPEIYTEQQLNELGRFKELAQKLYSLTVTANDLTNLKCKSLSKLLTDGFDEEQIWQQIEIQNKAALLQFSKVVPSIDANDISFAVRRDVGIPKSSKIQEEGTDDSNVEESYAFDDDSDIPSEMDNVGQGRGGEEDSEPGEGYAFDDDSDSDAEMIRALRKRQKENELNNEESANNETKSSKKISGVPKKSSSYYRSEVDDQFFKLSKLEEFLRIEDLREEKKRDEDDFKMNDDDDDDIDLFQDIPSDIDNSSAEDSNDETDKKASKDFMYEDFFDEPDSGDESIDNENDKPNLDDSDENCENLDDMSEDNNLDMNSTQKDGLHVENSSKDTSVTTQKSFFELEQEKIKKQIREYEKKILEPMPWHLTGEVAANNRPIDSLLDQEADFESNARKEHLVDNALTEKVENIIKMAIMNKAYSDVERKVKPVEEIIAYKKEVALEQTKSKKSLAQVYEEDFLKQKTKQEEEVDPKHKEIQKLMDSLFPELHALFSHIPKPAVPEIKIVTNLPAITVEEVAPTSVSDVTLLAPEEVKKKTGLIKGTTERTDTDRKHERRKKKIHQRLKEKKNKEKLELQKAKNPTAKMSKLEKLETIKKLKQNKNTKLASIDEGGKIKSSKDFFSRLQDTVDKRKFKNQTAKKKAET